MRTLPLTLYGQTTTGIEILQGESLALALTCQDPSTRAAFSLASSTLTASLALPDLHGNPTLPAELEREAAITLPATLGTGNVVLTAAETAALPAGAHIMDVVAETTAGVRTVLLRASRVVVVAGVGMP